MAWTTLGQEHLTAEIERANLAGKLNHAYLLTGPNGVGKKTLAREIFAAANCRGEDKPCGECTPCVRTYEGTHTDLQTVGAEGNETRVPIERMRESAERLYLTSVEGGFTGLIVDGADLMSTEGGNAILKTLEEPPGQTLIMMLAESRQGVMDTVRSRCRTLALRRMGTTTIERMLEERTGTAPEAARTIAQQAEGCWGRAVALARNSDALDAAAAMTAMIRDAAEGTAEERMKAAQGLAESMRGDRNAAGQIMRAWHTHWRGRLRAAIANSDHAKAAQAVSAIERGDLAGDRLARNANARLTLETLTTAGMGART